MIGQKHPNEKKIPMNIFTRVIESELTFLYHFFFFLYSKLIGFSYQIFFFFLYSKVDRIFLSKFPTALLPGGPVQIIN